jgi:hypothetical protein
VIVLLGKISGRHYNYREILPGVIAANSSAPRTVRLGHVLGQRRVGAALVGAHVTPDRNTAPRAIRSRNENVADSDLWRQSVAGLWYRLRRSFLHHYLHCLRYNGVMAPPVRRLLRLIIPLTTRLP